jgi:hypothetical protein
MLVLNRWWRQDWCLTKQVCALSGNMYGSSVRMHRGPEGAGWERPGQGTQAALDSQHQRSVDLEVRWGS